MTYICRIPWIWMTVILLLPSIRYVNSTNCTEEAKNRSVAVVRFCTNDSAKGNPVIIDGFYANNLDITVCICKANVSSSKKLSYGNAYNISPFSNAHACESTVFFSQPFVEEQSQSCQINGSYTIKNSLNIVQVILRKDVLHGDTRYCLKLEVDTNNQLEVSCHQNVEIKMSTVDIDAATETIFEDPVSITEGMISSSIQDTVFETSETNGRLNDVTSATQQNVNETMGRKGNVTEGFQNVESDRFKLMYIAIGCGAGGGLIVIMTVLWLINSSRRETTPPRECHANSADNNDDGLINNSLYVSTDDNDIQRNRLNQLTPDMNVNLNYVVYQTEGNYSDIDLDDKERAKTVLDKSSFEGLRTDDGNCSEVDIAGIQDHPSSSHTKDELSVTNTKYSGKENESFETTFTNTRNAMRSSTLKHITSPNGSDCEYAVVEKQGSASGRNEEYAVVDKTRKRNT